MDQVIENSSVYLEGRGGVFCRGCLSTDLFSALDLGFLPLANELLLNQNCEVEKFPLHLKVCRDCGLGQVSDVTTPDRIFRDYRYLSSTSATFLQHAAAYVQERLIDTTFSQDEWVLEIASNDGYLLKNFLKAGISAIGVEPAENVAEISRKLGITTISEFFSSNLAKELLLKNGFPKLVIANNVMAHVPDLRDFIEGLSILCGPETKISIENPSLANILIGLQFDTIYHEHYSYLTATAVSKLSRVYGLELSAVENLSIHGGTNRYWLKRATPDSKVHLSVTEAIHLENLQGLSNSANWEAYSLQVSELLGNFSSWLKSAKADKRIIFGYGAAAKASTILNSIDLGIGEIHAISDASLEKQGRYMPAVSLEIISPEILFLEKPTDVVIFPWNIKKEIADFLRGGLGNQTRLWCIVPNMHEVTIK